MRRLFCFEFENLHEACESFYSFGNAKLIGSDKVYLGIYMLIEMGEPVKVYFYETKEQVDLGEPAFIKTLQTCYIEVENNLSRSRDVW